jgi:hypothetical protein
MVEILEVCCGRGFGEPHSDVISQFTPNPLIALDIQSGNDKDKYDWNLNTNSTCIWG